MTEDPNAREEIKQAHKADQIGYVRYLCERYLEKDPDHAATLVRYAWSLISLAQYRLAAEALDRAEAVAPENRRHYALGQRGHLLEAQGRFAEAERVFLEAKGLDPADDATYLIFAGSAAFGRGDIETAIDHARAATQCAEGCIDEAYFNLGGYLLSAQRYQEAAECYRKALEIAPKYEIARERLDDVRLVLDRIAADRPA